MLWLCSSTTSQQRSTSFTHPCLVTWCTAMLEVAGRRWIVAMKGCRWSAVKLIQVADIINPNVCQDNILHHHTTDPQQNSGFISPDCVPPVLSSQCVSDRSGTWRHGSMCYVLWVCHSFTDWLWVTAAFLSPRSCLTVLLWSLGSSLVIITETSVPYLRDFVHCCHTVKELIISWINTCTGVPNKVLTTCIQ